MRSELRGPSLRNRRKRRIQRRNAPRRNPQPVIAAVRLAAEMAGGPMAGPLLFERRRVLGAERQLPDRAARMEMAARGRLDRVRHVALQDDAAPLDATVRD